MPMANTRKLKTLQSPIKAKQSHMKPSRISMMNKTHFSLGTIHSENLLTCLILLLTCLLGVLCDSYADEPFPKEKCEELLPECLCDEGYMDVAVLICRNLRNFDNLTRTLSDGSVFKVNSTLDITLSGVLKLPRGFLKDLVLQRLYIDEIQTVEVEDGAFDGMLQLQKFYIQLSSLKEIPNFRPISNSLRNLNLDNSRITSISGERLKNLPILETVSFVNNSIQSVASDAFEGTDNVIIFDLSYNRLTTLPQNLFNSWKKLNKVVLTYNRLLNVDHLFTVVNPSFIYLDHNNLTDLDSILYPNMTKLQTLLLSYNPFRNITENSFNGKVTHLHSLFMDHCFISGFNASHFKELPHLSALDLSYNLIENVTNQTIQFGVGLELNFVGNKIKEFDVDLAYRVAHLNLNKNLLTSVSRSLQNSQILDVNMADNLIETMGPEDFRGVFGVQTVDLHNNLISKVDPLTFQGIRRDLIHLDLSLNQIRSLHGCLRDLHLLNSLNLTGNLIEFLEVGEFHGMVELLELYLDGNFITTLGDEMQQFDQLQLLSISNNRISTLKPEQIPRTLKYLYLEGNPFKCNCELLAFLLFINSSSIGTDRPLCTPSNQTSLQPPARCPVGCSCFCYENKDKHFLSVDCSSTGLIELPPLFRTETSKAKENRSSIAIHLPRASQLSQSGPFVIEDEIGGLDLTHNKLKSLEGADLPGRLQHLLLAENHLLKPPLSLLYSLENLKNVSLSGNPWNCDCELLHFKEWILYKSEIVIDANETRCGTQSPALNGRTIWSLSDMDLCPVKTSSSLIIGLLCLLLVIAVITIALVAYWTNVKRWLAVRGITYFQDFGTDQSKEFENLHLLHMNGQEVNRRNNFPLPEDRQRHIGEGAEFHHEPDSLFQERPVDRPEDGYVSLTSQSRIPV